MQQPRVHTELLSLSLTPTTQYIVREYNKEKLVFEQFSAAYEDFKAGALPLLESLEKGASFPPLLHMHCSHSSPSQTGQSAAQKSPRPSRNWIGFASASLDPSLK